MSVPFLRPDIRDVDLERMTRSIKTGWLVHGPETLVFENALKEYLGVKDAVMVGSCTAALHMSLIAAEVADGDEVITTPLSWVATSNVILYQRAIPVFVDVEPATGLIDVSKIEEKITSKTKAILIVHIYGQMLDIKALKEIADRHNVKIIEDSAHALESRYDGIRPGHLGFTSCLSFHVAKNITAGQGGAVVTNDLEVGRRMRLLRRDGVLNAGGKRVMTEFGYKYDSTDYQAALLIGQLERIEETHVLRNKMFDVYNKAFTKAGVPFATYSSLENHASHMFIVYVNPLYRDLIRTELAEKGVETSIHYQPIHLEPYYREKFGYKEGDYPIAEKLGASSITLPTYTLLEDAEQQYVIATLLDSIKSHAE